MTSSKVVSGFGGYITILCCKNRVNCFDFIFFVYPKVIQIAIEIKYKISRYIIQTYRTHCDDDASWRYDIYITILLRSIISCLLFPIRTQHITNYEKICVLKPLKPIPKRALCLCRKIKDSS